MSAGNDEFRLRVFAYGGGVQSTAALVLAAEGKIDFKTFLFCNTGDDSENPDTLRYVRDVATPWAAERGIEVIELRRSWKDGRDWTLRDMLVDHGRMVIPVFRGEGPPMSRSCTADFKIGVIDKWLADKGAIVLDPGVVGLGISTDEIQRAKSEGPDPQNLRQWRVYPLIHLGLRRTDCAAIIRDAGLEVPPKSACFFCPFHSRAAWRDLKRQTPELFEDACVIEEKMSAQTSDGRPVFMTRSTVPLREQFAHDQGVLLFDGDDCDTGYCFT